MERDAVILDAQRVTKHFGGTLALDAVDLQIRGGEVHALLGENGAGKSTLIKILAGVHQADSGRIVWRGRPVHPSTDRPPITFIHQDLGLVDSMTVAENVAIVVGYPRLRGLIAWHDARRSAAAILDRMGGGGAEQIDPDALVRDLSAAGKSIVAIARALAVRCEILVLDEPTAALPEPDVERLLDVLRRLRADGIGIVYVTHRLDEVFRIADRVTVLRDGRGVGTMRVATTSPAALIEAIIGRRLEELLAKPALPAARSVLDVRDLVTRHVGPVSFTVVAGEVLGLVGLRGAGHDTTGRAVFGDVPIAAGSIMLDGVLLQIDKPREAVRMGIGFVSSKRREESLAPTMCVRENLFINPAINGYGTFQPIDPAAERERCGSELRRLSVRPPDSERPIMMLSGGNQQKVVLARWMEANSRLLILEEPTVGVDVGSKVQIYQLLQQLLTGGSAVLMISSDFEDVVGVCHRALVFDRGRVVAELDRDSLSIPRLTAAASGIV